MIKKIFEKVLWNNLEAKKWKKDDDKISQNEDDEVDVTQCSFLGKNFKMNKR